MSTGLNFLFDHLIEIEQELIQQQTMNQINEGKLIALENQMYNKIYVTNLPSEEKEIYKIFASTLPSTNLYNLQTRLNEVKQLKARLQS